MTGTSLTLDELEGLCALLWLNRAK